MQEGVDNEQCLVASYSNGAGKQCDLTVLGGTRRIRAGSFERAGGQ